LQGRSPQEVVGIVSTSMMVQSMIIATIAFAGHHGRLHGSCPT
jgi:hypothetical protein